MYAEERQQAIARSRDAGRAGCRSTELADEVRASRPRRSGATSPPWSAPAWCAGCTAAPSPRTPSRVLESGGLRPRPRQRRREGPDRRRRAGARARSGGSVLLDAGTTTARLAGALPRDRKLDGDHPRGPDRRPARRPPRRSCSGCSRAASARPPRRPSARTPSRPSTGCAPTSRSSAPTASRSSTASPPPTTTRRRSSGRSSPAPVSVVVLADADKIGQEHLVRFAGLDEVDVLVTDARATREELAPIERRRRRRSWSRDRHPHRQPELRPHDRARRPARARRASCAPTRSSSRPAARGSTSRGPRPPPEWTPSRSSRPRSTPRSPPSWSTTASPAGRCRRPDRSGSTSRSPSPTAPPPRSTAPVRPPTRRCSSGSAPRSPSSPTAPAGSCSPGRCRPGTPPSWYAEVAAALAGTSARRSRSTPPTRR